MIYTAAANGGRTVSGPLDKSLALPDGVSLGDVCI